MVLIVDVVGRLLGGAVPGQVEQVRGGRQYFGLGQYVQVRIGTLQQIAEYFNVLGDFVAELAIELVTAYA